MKTLLTFCGLLAALTLHAADAGLTARPATQAEVNAGTLRSKFVSPATLANRMGTNGAFVQGVQYATLEDAVKGSGSGATITVQGVVNISPASNGVLVANRRVMATGAVLLNNNTNITAGIPLGLKFGSGLTWSGGIISNIYSGSYGGCYGLDHRQGDSAVTNVYVENLRGYGDTDVVFINHTNACVNVVLQNCGAVSKWDAIVMNVPGKGLDFQGGSYEVNGLSTVAGADPRVLKINGGLHSFTGVRFVLSATNGQDVASAQLQAPALSPTDFGSTNTLTGCTFTGNLTNAAGVIATGVKSSGGSHLVILNGCTVDPDMSQTTAGVGLRVVSGGRMQVFNTMVMPNQTNAQVYFTGSGAQTMTVSGGNITFNRITGGLFGTRFSGVGDIIAPQGVVTPTNWPNITWVTNGLSCEVNSNGTMFRVTSKVGATNQAWLKVADAAP